MEHTFSIMPIEVFMDNRLSKNDIRVLGAILSFRNKETNLCWPKRDQISERCGLPITRISTVTTNLVKLGWLKKEGLGGCSRASSYSLKVPEIKVVTITKPVTVTEAVTVTKPVTKTVTETVTKTVTKPVTRIKQTNEQTIEQTNKKKKSSKKKSVPDLISIDAFTGLTKKEQELFIEYIEMRNALKLLTTDNVINRLLKKYHEFGRQPEVIQNAITANWKDFYAPKTLRGTHEANRNTGKKFGGAEFFDVLQEVAAGNG